MEVHAFSLQILLNQIAHLLVELSKNTGPDHHAGIKAKTVQEAGTLKSDVRRSDNQSFA